MTVFASENRRKIKGEIKKGTKKKKVFLPKCIVIGLILLSVFTPFVLN